MGALARAQELEVHVKQLEGQVEEERTHVSHERSRAEKAEARLEELEEAERTRVATAPPAVPVPAALAAEAVLGPAPAAAPALAGMGSSVPTALTAASPATTSATAAAAAVAAAQEPGEPKGAAQARVDPSGPHVVPSDPSTEAPAAAAAHQAGGIAPAGVNRAGSAVMPAHAAANASVTQQPTTTPITHTTSSSLAPCSNSDAFPTRPAVPDQPPSAAAAVAVVKRPAAPDQAEHAAKRARIANPGSGAGHGMDVDRPVPEAPQDHPAPALPPPDVPTSAAPTTHTAPSASAQPIATAMHAAVTNPPAPLTTVPPARPLVPLLSSVIRPGLPGSGEGGLSALGLAAVTGGLRPSGGSSAGAGLGAGTSMHTASAPASGWGPGPAAGIAGHFNNQVSNPFPGVLRPGLKPLPLATSHPQPLPTGPPHAGHSLAQLLGQRRMSSGRRRSSGSSSGVSELGSPARGLPLTQMPSQFPAVMAAQHGPEAAAAAAAALAEGAAGRAASGSMAVHAGKSSGGGGVGTSGSGMAAAPGPQSGVGVKRGSGEAAALRPLGQGTASAAAGAVQPAPATAVPEPAAAPPPPPPLPVPHQAAVWADATSGAAHAPVPASVVGAVLPTTAAVARLQPAALKGAGAPTINADPLPVAPADNGKPEQGMEAAVADAAAPSGAVMGTSDVAETVLQVQALPTHSTPASACPAGDVVSADAAQLQQQARPAKAARQPKGPGGALTGIFAALAAETSSSDDEA